MTTNLHLVQKTTLIVIAIAFCLMITPCVAQRQAKINYVKMDAAVTAQNPGEISYRQPFFFNRFDYLVWEFANIAKAGIANKREIQRIQSQKEESMTKLRMIKNQFEEYTSFPETMVDGWHNAIATDNSNFCKDVKVYVTDNRVRKFIIDNHVPIDFVATRDIKNGKNLVSLKSFNGEDLSIVELFFIYDLDEPSVVDPPIDPGFVCFWSDMKTFADIQISLNGNRIENLTVSYPFQPEPFANGTVSRILKPGTYSYVALGKGAIDWKGTFVVRPGEVAMVRFGR